MKSRRVSVRRIALAIGTLAVSTVFAWHAQPLVHGNEAAINVIVTVFSILAGFLVGIIAVVGDVALLTPGSWRAVEINRNAVVNKLIRHKWLFVAYLMTLGLIFASMLLQKNWPSTTLWIERVYLTLGFVAFFCSVELPASLMRAQIERIDFEIEARRQQVGIPTPPPTPPGKDVGPK